MTYLELCQRARQECGIAGDGPSAVTGQQGQLQRIVDWVATAWIEIQQKRTDWFFMRKLDQTFSTAAATRDYLPSTVGFTDLAEFDTSSFMLYDPAIGESDQYFLEYIPFYKWRDRFRAGMNARDDNKPTMVTITPEGAMRFESRPDGIYTVTFDYKRSVQTLAANTDEPTGLPDRFDMMIVYETMKKFANFYSAEEVYQAASEPLSELWMQLERDQLPHLDMSPEPIA